MAVFAVMTESRSDVDTFMAESNAKLNELNFIKNPFKGGIKKLATEADYDYWGISMKPIYPQFFWAGLVLVLIQLFFSSFTLSWWMLSGTIIFLLGVFWNSCFFYVMLKKGLRMHGYLGQIKKISNSSLIDKIIKS